MMLANISVPLLGLVDTAVIGHLSNAYFLAAIALGSSSVSLIFWLLGFLRMSTTGLVAQRFGERNEAALLSQLYASATIAIGLSVLLLLLQSSIISLVANLSNASPDLMASAGRYIEIRLLSAPAAMMNLVLLGALLGLQNGKGPFYVVLFSNGLNIILDVWFVVGLDLNVVGAAWATCISDYLSCALAIGLVVKSLGRANITMKWLPINLSQITHLLHLNRDIFFRSLVLQACFSFMTFYGARLGDITLATNAVLLNFLLLISFAMDGIAYALEAKVGEAVGQKSQAAVHRWVKVGFFWGAVFAFGYTFTFAVFGPLFVASLTSLDTVQANAAEYLPWIVVMPLIATSCFLFDGIFVGLMRAKDMRNSMIISGVVGFAVPFILTSSFGNHALWFAMSCFMALRGITLGLRYRTVMGRGLFDQALVQND
ncbi:MATE family efflux transporter [Pseudoalteromonas xiamenensis]|uniref:MATE family efflux transporter n=1 Tax=Pseudoalteromonas xiamenensis TaxID=882626 RepID=UPI0035EFD99D